MGKKKGGQAKAGAAEPEVAVTMTNEEKLSDADAAEAKEKMEIAKVAAEKVAAAKIAEEEAKVAEDKAAAKAAEEAAAKEAEEAAAASSKAAAEAVAAALAAEAAAKAAQEEAAAKAAEAAAKAKAAGEIATAAARSAADQMASAQTPLEAAMKQAAKMSEEGRAAAEASVANAAEEVAMIKKASSTDLKSLSKNGEEEKAEAAATEDESATKAVEAAATATAYEAAAETAAAAARAIWPEYEASDNAVEQLSEDQVAVEVALIKAAEEGMAGKAAAAVAVSTAAEEVAAIKAQTIENTTDGTVMIVDRAKAEQLAEITAAATKQLNKAAASAEVATSEAMAERLALLATAALKAENMAAADAMLAEHNEEQLADGKAVDPAAEGLAAFGVQLVNSSEKASAKGGLAKSSAAAANVTANLTSEGKYPNSLFISHALDVAQTGTRPAVWQPGGKPFVSYADCSTPPVVVDADSASAASDDWDFISHSDVAVAVASHAYSDYSLAVEMTKASIEDAIKKLATAEEAARRLQTGGSFPYMIVCEHWSIWGGAYYTVYGLDSEEEARASATAYWACLLLLKRQADGTYEELEEGGYTSTVTFGYVHSRIRRWVDEQQANSGGLEALAVPTETA